MTIEITRKELVAYLKELLSDEFDAEELVCYSDTELIYQLITIAKYYKNL